MIVPAEGEFRLNSEDRTRRLGAALAGALKKGEAVCLSGPLGAGKSVLARAMIHSLCPAEPEVPSPTFTLVQFYDAPKFPLAHFDLYRLASADEAFEIGLDEAIKDGAAVIEWAEKLGHHLPHDRVDVEIAVTGDDRRARLRCHGAWEGRPLAL
ncbi:MAG TPA: tRNA (adenosine(37)-N6)-threonylcarbamoyltransferase complex ATPase subunit type 1 TsaE [Caulobacteraceae bacterium]|jgi:tRNA threonylcarbamoyladenosine biosynthesis protein TsaE|nr:tRNA (adenosine(37)-N6)-threonylcarbamoyltransferase complex ATPase subunit type 1 TsaE [Caulobacteraceae bacterium]